MSGRIPQLLACLGLILISGAANADVVLDGSLGPAGPVEAVDGDFTISEQLGRRAGTSLFHSFARFDVGRSQSATFSAESALDRIVARVTGGLPSEIDGTLRSTVPGAALFLLNPSGVVFGQTARLEVPGSFHVSTAPLLRFTDGSAWPTGEVTSDVLTTAPPQAFGFLGDAPAPIELGRTQLAVPAGEQLSVVAGDVEARGALRIPTLSAPSGEIRVASVGSALDVPVDVASLPVEIGGEQLGRISLTQQALFDVSAPPGSALRAGRIVVRGGELVVEGSRLTATSRGDAPAGGEHTALDLAVEGRIGIGIGSIVSTAGIGPARGGDASLRADLLEVYDSAVLGVAALGEGPGGSLRVDAQRVEIRGAGQLASQSTGAGAGGQIAIRTDTLLLESGGELLSDARGSAGDVSIDARSLLVREGGRIASSDAGALRLRADSLEMRGGEISSQTRTSAQGGAIEIHVARADLADAARVISTSQADGAGGRVDVEAGDLELRAGAQLLSAAEAEGPGGAISVRANRILLSNVEDREEPTQIATRTLQLGPGAGRGGALQIAGHELLLEAGGQVSTTTEGSGRAGDLGIETSARVRVSGANAFGPSGLFARAAATADGAGGSLRISSPDLEVRDGGQVSARTFGAGPAGDLEIVAGRLAVEGGPNGASVLSTRGFDGSGGSLRVQADRLALRGGGLLTASTLRLGDSGDVDVEADHVTISGADPRGGNPSGIFAQTNALPDVPGAGDAGDVRLAARVLELDDGGRISVLTRGEGRSGDIDIRASERLRVAGGASITAQSTGSGDAGSISIDAGLRLDLEGGAISTEAEEAYGGNVRVRASERVFLDRGDLTTSVGSGEGRGGDIDVDPRFVVLRQSRILARADAGDGGNISIVTDHLLVDPQSAIDASSRLGIDGRVFISSPETDLSGELGVLPESFLDAASRMDPTCAVQTGRRGSFRILPGAPGPPGPEGPLRILPGSLDTE